MVTHAPPGWMALLVAPVIGSFLGVVVQRLPAGQSLGGRSRCDHCGQQLTARDLVPLLSFALQRGHCRHCRAPIGWFAPAIELVALLAAAAVLLAGASGWFVWVLCGLGWALLTAAWIDAQHLVLPDVITLPLLLAGLAVTWVRAPYAIYDHALAAAFGYAAFRGLDWVYARLRGRHGLGAGDAKLLAAGGAWAGLAALPGIVLGAGLLGLAVALPLALRQGSDGRTMIPFGPALAVAVFAVMLLVG